MHGSIHPARAALRQQASALMAWWHLAGVDHAVSDHPASWLAPAPAPAGLQPRPAPALPPASPAPSSDREDWSGFPTLEALIAHLRADWPLCPVIDGNPASGLLLVGEAPSAEDLRTGRPFSGPAGAMLDRMLGAIDLDRTACAIMLLACRRRVPGKPPPDAVARDLPLARRLIELVAPRHIMLLGQIPTDALGNPGRREAIGAMRGRWVDVDGVPALVSYNPAYLLHAPTAENKAAAWADLLAFRARIGR